MLQHRAVVLGMVLMLEVQVLCEAVAGIANPQVLARFAARAIAAGFGSRGRHRPAEGPGS